MWRQYRREILDRYEADRRERRRKEQEEEDNARREREREYQERLREQVSERMAEYWKAERERAEREARANAEWARAEQARADWRAEWEEWAEGGRKEDAKEEKERTNRQEPAVKNLPNLPHYVLLGLERSCKEKDITSAYKRLALLHHPDKNGGCKKSEELFKKVCSTLTPLFRRCLPRRRSSTLIRFSPTQRLEELTMLLASHNMGSPAYSGK